MEYHSRQEEQIYIRLLAGGYDTWLNDLVDNYGIERVDMTDAFELLDYFKDNLNGYLLYQVGNGSINSATSLAGIEQAIVVEQSIENQVIALGLNLIHDMRNVEESWVYDNYKEQLKTPLDEIQLMKQFVLSVKYKGVFP